MATSLLELFTPYAIQVGVSCIGAHLILYILFVSETFGNGPWSAMPSFTAHKVITLPVLTYLSIQGLLYFNVRWMSSSSSISALDRVLIPQHEHLSEFMFGMMFFWDIPVALCTPALRQPQMILHHLGMITLAAFSLGIFSNGTFLFGYYVPFYFGFIEISSLPLVVVDLFRPKHKEWNAYLTSAKRPKWFATVNKECRLYFAIFFMLIRTIAFPYVSVMGVTVDVMHITSLPLDQRENVSDFPLFVMSVLNVFFSALQLYWGSLILPQLWKAFIGSVKEIIGKTKNL